MLITVKMPTIDGNCWHFNIDKEDKFHGQSYEHNFFYNLKA